MPETPFNPDRKQAERDLGERGYCGFCGKSQHEVRKLIAGPIASICNECVELQHGMLLNEDPGRKRSLHEVLSRARQRRISELEAENARLREALDDIHMHGFDVGANVMVPKVEWDAAFARAALSQEDRDGN